MSTFTFASIDVIPRVLQLVVGLLGLILSIKARSRGVSGLMVGAFVLMLVATAAGIIWRFVSVNVPSWASSGGLSVDEIQWIFMGVSIPLDAVALLSWLLVAIAVAKSGNPSRQQPGFAPNPGPVNYPMTPQPGFQPPQPGYPQSNPPTQQPPS
ncbi:hypothetical protein NQK81_41945 [Amycolatopsis roodepoortensis]|uniref:hypothetical protein n=1 Tax=Amycolatopsis roodepoortensis TaxID=700274 RepID=UPI00214BFFE6|nr:hypothetical protein [Amycolatopsis roodepoortensis]UUV31242.1 hypothetical protein NQK81_41945 [Amycolatopsis roodepoortensis]